MMLFPDLAELPTSPPRCVCSARQICVSDRPLSIMCSLSLSHFAPHERLTIQALYVALSSIYTIATRHYFATDRRRCAIQGVLQHAQWKHLINMVRHLGRTATETHTTHMLEVCHDLKGGALTALVGLFDALDHTDWTEEDLQLIAHLAHDHTLIMRDMVTDLDPYAAGQDRARSISSAALLSKQWHDAVYRIGSRCVRVIVDCRYHGPITAYQCEPAMLERVIYNLVNNAAHYSNDGIVELSIRSFPEHGPRQMHVAVANQLPAEQQAILQQRFPASMDQLFHGGFTTDGSGLGMHIAAQIIAAAHGFATIQECLTVGHLGVTLCQDRFISWFHWPINAR